MFPNSPRTRQPIDLIQSHINPVLFYSSAEMVQNRLRTFTGFGCLPKELRDYIWDLAIQNKEDEPEIHFYSASATKETYQYEWWQHPTEMEWDERQEFMKAPKWKTRKGFDSAWASRKNPPGYLLDSGLWLACVESREAVVRIRKTDDLYYSVASVKVPPGKGSWQRCIVMRPARDLIVYQLYDIASLPKGLVRSLLEYHDIWFDQLCYGIKYDPQWAPLAHEVDQEPGAEGESGLEVSDSTVPVSCLLQELFLCVLSNLGELWVVDHYTLRPAAGITFAELSKNRRVFRARGCKYVEVCFQDIIGGRWVVADGFEQWQTPLGFIDGVKDHPEYESCLRYLNPDFDSGRPLRMMMWSVAACVRDA